jgi:hypothetical protein
MRYAQRVNRARGGKGHVWQGRFFSSPLDDTYLFAIRVLHGRLTSNIIPIHFNP